MRKIVTALSLVSFLGTAACLESEADLDGTSIQEISERSNRNEVRAAIESNGWHAVWGDLINEADVVTGVIAFITDTFPAWVQYQIDEQVDHFSRSAGDVGIDLAKEVALRAFDSRQEDCASPHLGVKAGIATYDRWMELGVGHIKTNLPNNHQPYVAFRIYDNGDCRPSPPAPPPPPTCTNGAVEGSSWSKLVRGTRCELENFVCRNQQIVRTGTSKIPRCTEL